MIEFKMERGELCLFNNRRVLHARRYHSKSLALYCHYTESYCLLCSHFALRLANIVIVLYKTTMAHSKPCIFTNRWSLHARRHVCGHPYRHACLQACAQECAQTCAHACVQACIHICMPAGIYTGICIGMHAEGMRTDMHKNMHIDVHFDAAPSLTPRGAFSGCGWWLQTTSTF